MPSRKLATRVQQSVCRQASLSLACSSLLVLCSWRHLLVSLSVRSMYMTSYCMSALSCRVNSVKSTYLSRLTMSVRAMRVDNLVFSSYCLPALVQFDGTDRH
ncbi:hypothetical protein KP509_31G056900 [Ceratopteris richardii]|uniref:Uncharacterized protein n=1 Tax=Ceratopteris richardii TaxID=49495 RepID=A0A8T2QZM2_CERRI|nr:hypothetical protein KP509_31G056900 [Ceratopteris richardii]